MLILGIKYYWHTAKPLHYLNLAVSDKYLEYNVIEP